ncbi:MAG: hypothetical protein IPL25_10265 [Saprospiraceae bacterium]|nr:hypothetical protein [Candidatus Vicinibacter affinis]
MKDVLNLKQKIGENPIFVKEVRDFKNESVLDIAKVAGSLKDTLIEQNIDFEKATKSDWERLINDKIITEDQQINLVKVTEAFRFTGGNSTLTSKLLEKNSLVDIVKYDKDDWKGLIDEAENPEEYASVLVKAAQKKIPKRIFY